MKVHLDSLGCRLNQSEIESFGRQFRAAGHELVADPEHSELVVINTCTVTQDAAAASRARVRSAHRSQPEAAIVLTGCWSTLERKSALALPGVVLAVPNATKNDLVRQVISSPIDPFDLDPVVRQPLPGIRTRTRAFVKAQDGCDHHCTFCLTTLARGPASSLPIDFVVDQVRAAVAGGAQEAVISGVQLSGYGNDLPGNPRLTGLVQAILDRTEIPRLRMSSLEPWGLPEDFFNLWQDPRMCRQLHFPLQSGSPSTLKRMGRPTRPSDYRLLVERARSAIPGLAVTTDLIAGFPGETEKEFQESLHFVEEMQFADAHVFPYSARPGTGAAKLPERVDAKEVKARAQALRLTVADSAADFRRQFVSRRLDVLWEAARCLGPDGWTLSGWSDNYIRVTASASQDLWNRICAVLIDESTSEGLAGRLAS
jgi:threonylcarbamoyladenosine tRNA methylthiotransferase MtaB